MAADGIFRRRFISQLLATEVVNILKILDGMHRGYMIHMILSRFLTQEYEQKTDGNGVQPTEELLWISPLFSLLAVPLFGTLFIDRFGRRLSFVVVYLASLLSWIFTLNSTEIFHLYLGIGFAGIARSGANLVIPIFVTEISNPRVRGRLLTITTLNENIGLLMGFFGAFYGEKLVIIVSIGILSLMFLGYLMFLHESPIHYFRCGKPIDAEMSLKYYWNVKNYTSIKDSDEYIDYLDNLRRKWDSGVYQYSIAGTSHSCRSPKSSLKNMFIAVGMGSLPVFTGAYSFMCYIGNLKMREHKFQGDFTTTLIAMLILAVVGVKFSALLVDYIGRVGTLKISGWGCVLALLSSYSLDYISFSFSMHEVDSVLMWSLVAVIFLANIGFTSVWATVVIEILTEEQRLKGFCLSNGLSFFLEIVIASFFPYILQSIHFHGFTFICLIGCIGNLIVVKNFVPETQGKWLIN